MPEIILRDEQAGLIQALATKLIPHLSKSSVFQPTVLSEINRRFDTKVDHKSEEYVIHLLKRPKFLQALFRGVPLEGCAANLVIHWNQEHEDSQGIALDPHAFGTGEGGSFSWKDADNQKIAPWVIRKTDEGSVRFRRLSQESQDTQLKNLRDEIRQRQEGCTFNLSENSDFLSLLVALSSAGIDDSSSECAIHREKEVIYALWPLGNTPNHPTGWGYLKDEGEFSEEISCVVTRGIIKSLHVIFAFMKTLGAKLYEFRIGEGSKAVSVSFLGKGFVIKAIFERESGAKSYGILNQIPYLKNHLKESDCESGKRQNLTNLIWGISSARRWIQSYSGIEGTCSVRVDLDPLTEESTQIFFVQEQARVLQFLIGDSDLKTWESLVLTHEMVPPVQGHLRARVNHFHEEKEPVRLLLNQKTRTIQIGEKFQSGCILMTHTEGEELSKQLQVVGDPSGPTFTIPANQFDEESSLSVELSTLRTLSTSGSKVFGLDDTSLGVFTFKEGSLFLECGSNDSFVGTRSRLEIVSRSGLPSEDSLTKEGDFLSLGIPGAQFLGLVQLLTRRIALDKNKDLRVRVLLKAQVSGSESTGKLIPTIELWEGERRILTASFRMMKISTHKKPEDLGSWMAAKPQGSTITVQDEDLATIAQIAGTFCMSREKAFAAPNLAINSLASLYYDPKDKKIYASNTFLGVEYSLKENVFGEEPRLLSPGLLQAASILSRKKGRAFLTKALTRTALEEEGFTVQWPEPSAEPKHFPVPMLRKILDRENEFRSAFPWGRATGELVASTMISAWNAGIRRVSGSTLGFDPTYLIVTPRELIPIPLILLQSGLTPEEIWHNARSEFSGGITVQDYENHPDNPEAEYFAIGFNSLYLVSFLDAVRSMSEDQGVCSWALNSGLLQVRQDTWKAVLAPVSPREDEGDLIQPLLEFMRENHEYPRPETAV